MGKKTNYGEYNFGKDLDDLNACSNTDCTGALPRAPKSKAELDAYREVYDFEPPETAKKK